MTGPGVDEEDGYWPGPIREEALAAAGSLSPQNPRQEIKLHGVLRDRTFGCGAVVVVFSAALDDADFYEFRDYVSKWRGG